MSFKSPTHSATFFVSCGLFINMFCLSLLPWRSVGRFNFDKGLLNSTMLIQKSTYKNEKLLCMYIHMCCKISTKKHVQQNKHNTVFLAFMPILHFLQLTTPPAIFCMPTPSKALCVVFLWTLASRVMSWCQLSTYSIRWRWQLIPGPM